MRASVVQFSKALILHLSSFLLSKLTGGGGLDPSFSNAFSSHDNCIFKENVIIVFNVQSS